MSNYYVAMQRIPNLLVVTVHEALSFELYA
jgi:hypothetical protein